MGTSWGWKHNGSRWNGWCRSCDDGELTREIDAIGMYWLTVCAYPIVGAWGLCSLLYCPQKSWWSWLVNTGKWCLLLWFRDDDAAAIY